MSDVLLKLEEHCIVSANAPALFAKLGCHDGLGALPPGSRFRALDTVPYRLGQTEQLLPIIVQVELAGGAVEQADAEMFFQL